MPQPAANWDARERPCTSGRPRQLVRRLTVPEYNAPLPRFLPQRRVQRPAIMAACDLANRIDADTDFIHLESGVEVTGGLARAAQPQWRRKTRWRDGRAPRTKLPRGPATTTPGATGRPRTNNRPASMGMPRCGGAVQDVLARPTPASASTLTSTRRRLLASMRTATARLKKNWVPRTMYASTWAETPSYLTRPAGIDLNHRRPSRRPASSCRISRDSLSPTASRTSPEHHPPGAFSVAEL